VTSRWLSLALGPALALAGVLATPHARAQAPTAEETAEADVEAPELEDDDELRWPSQYRRVHWAEAVAAPLIIGGAFTLYGVGPTPTQDARNITAFDRNLGDALRVTGSAEEPLKLIGDIGYLGTFAYRFLDDILVAGAIRGGWDVAWQLLVIDSFALGLVGAVTFTSQVAFGRQRPKYYFCEEGGGSDEECDGGARENRSFISGHHAIAVAGAALTCMHHARFRIYRTKRSGRAACASHATVAAAVGISRLMVEAHWPTDVLLGSALGMVAGWLVPRLLHYGFEEHGHGHGQWDEDGGEGTARPSDPHRLRVMVMPDLGPRRAGLGAIGMW